MADSNNNEQYQTYNQYNNGDAYNAGYAQNQNNAYNTGYVQQQNDAYNAGYVQNENSAYNNGYGQMTNQQYMNSQASGDVFDDVFVDKTEVTVATLGNGFVLNMISGEGLKKEQAVLSDKRLYYNHKKGVIDTTSTRECVNIADITGTKITDNRQFSLVIIAIMFFLFGISFLTTGVTAGFWMFFVITIVFLLVYFFSRKKYLCIEYAGGCIRLSVKKYGMDNIIAFQKSIYKMKDSMGK